MAWSPGEYGTATSISVLSKYLWVLLKRSPPRDMSSHVTMSSCKFGRRTQALKLTRVRACFRRFSRSFVATPAPDDAAAGACAPSGVNGCAVTGSNVVEGAGVGVSIQAAPANADVFSCAAPCRSAARHGCGASGKPSAPGSPRASSQGALPVAASFHSVEDPHFLQ